MGGLVGAWPPLTGNSTCVETLAFRLNCGMPRMRHATNAAKFEGSRDVNEPPGVPPASLANPERTGSEIG